MDGVSSFIFISVDARGTNILPTASVPATPEFLSLLHHLVVIYADISQG